MQRKLIHLAGLEAAGDESCGYSLAIALREPAPTLGPMGSQLQLNAISDPAERATCTDQSWHHVCLATAGSDTLQHPPSSKLAAHF